MKDRIKEINHELWEIEETMKQLKKRTKVLTREKLEIQGLHKIVSAKQKYKHNSKSTPVKVVNEKGEVILENKKYKKGMVNINANNIRNKSNF